MNSKMVRRKSILLRLIRVPIRVLARARDLYMESLTGSHVSYGNTMGCPTPQIPTLPRSFSQSSSKSGDEELRDLIRLASTRDRIGVELRRSKSSVPLGGVNGAAVKVVPRSNTVPFGRIDEDKPLIDFGEDEDAGLLGGGYPKGRNHAVLA